MEDHTVTHFVVLFTAQKQKKFKTWQDGTMKYYSFNKKLILTDEKGYNIDKKFNKSGIPSEGDEIEFDGHLVAVESLTAQEPSMNEGTGRSIVPTPNPAAADHQQPQPHSTIRAPVVDNNNFRLARKRLRAAGGGGLSIRRFQSPLVTVAAVVDPPQEQQSVHHTIQGVPIQNPIPTANTTTTAIAAMPPLSSMAIETDPTHEPAHSKTPLSNTPHSEFLRQCNSTIISYSPPPQSQLTRNSPSSPMTSVTQSVCQPLNSSIPLQQQRVIIPDTAPTNTSEQRGGPAPVLENNRPTEGGSPEFDDGLDWMEVCEQAEAAAVTAPPGPVQQGGLFAAMRNRRPRVGISKRSLPPPPVSDTPARLNNASLSESSVGMFVKASTVREYAPISHVDSTAPPTGFSASSSSSSKVAPKPFKSPVIEGTSVPLVLQFPTKDKAMSILQSKKHPKRTRTVPSHFPNVNHYRDVFKKIIHEHIQIMLINYAVYYYSVHSSVGNSRSNNDLERSFRSKGLGFYGSCKLQSDGRFHTNIASTRFRLKIQNREHHSKYGKDDVWIVSKSPAFEAHSTFLGRSTYYGPFSYGLLEIECLSPRDGRVASTLVNEGCDVYALRTISATTEFMMLDGLDDKLEYLPLLPYLLSNGTKKKTRKQPAVLNEPIRDTLDYIKIRQDDNVDVEKKIRETIQRFRLNDDQANVLRQVARSVIVAPGWNEKADNPIVLVHGVFGSGKSFLAATLIIFLRDIIDSVCLHREPDDIIQFRILVSSMTNVAVDRILSTLLKLGYDDFVRVGSLKKISKSVLPYTAKARMSGNEEIKELEQMLEDPQNSEEDNELISTTLQRFRKNESSIQVQTAQVVGTTCVASAFEVFNGATFSLTLVDEASQLTEPLSMVPLSRFRCSRLVMIGDPMQLPPTVTTNSEEGKMGQGLEKTLFDRLTEIGHNSTMLRTQYRCHPSISALSNHLFYGRRLVDGVTKNDRSPLITGLPNVTFINVDGGQEQKNPRTQSFWNDNEIAVAAHMIEGFFNLGIAASDVGIISLYKEQADRIESHVKSSMHDQKQPHQHVQISTVDAFQGGEKEVIILSTVRTTNSAFIDNHPRINVALTRAKRHLFILGKQGLLMMNELWSYVLNQCQETSVTSHDFARLLAQLQMSHEVEELS